MLLLCHNKAKGLHKQMNILMLKRKYDENTRKYFSQCQCSTLITASMASTVLADGLIDGIYFTHNISNCVYFKTLLKLVCSCDVVLASPQLLGVTGESGLNC